jgi:large subunit ribosomal protein L16
MLYHNLKFSKIRKGKLNFYKFNNLLFFGFIGLKSVESGFLSINQLEIIKKILVSQTRKKLKIWLNINYFIKLTHKALGTRMGKGKGKFNVIVFKIKAGTIFLEICGINKKLIIDILLKLKSKLPFKTKIIFYFKF